MMWWRKTFPFSYRIRGRSVLLLALISLSLLHLLMIVSRRMVDFSTFLQEEEDILSSRTSVVPGGENLHLAPGLQFVLVVGLEGTGHHFMGRILQASPAFNRLKHHSEVGLLQDGDYDYRHQIKDLHSALFDMYHGSGLWNLPCDAALSVDATKTTFPSTAITNKSNPDRTTPTAHEKEQVRRLQHVVTVLKRIQQAHARTRSSLEGKQTVIRFPVNTVNVDKEDKNTFGQASYPNFGGPCREFQYPRLDLWYRACAMAAGMADPYNHLGHLDDALDNCRHVYLYRDPYQILDSTTLHRPFNVNLSQGIGLYQRLLSNVLLPELTKYSNQSLGCLGFYEQEHPQQDNVDNENLKYHLGDWKQTLLELGQWRNATKLEETIDRIYHPPFTMKDAFHSNTTSSSSRSRGMLALLEPNSPTIRMMEKWKHSHERLLKLCSEQ